MSTSNNIRKIVDPDVSAGLVELISRDGGHVFRNKATLEVAKKYFVYPIFTKGKDDKFYINYRIKKLVGGDLIDIPSLSFAFDDIDISGPHLPYFAPDRKGKFDAGPTKPCVKISIEKNHTEMQEILDYFDASAKCAFIFASTGYKNASFTTPGNIPLTFVPKYREISGAKTATKKNISIKSNTLGVLTDKGEIVSIPDFEEKIKRAPDDKALDILVDKYTTAYTVPNNGEEEVIYSLKDGYESYMRKPKFAEKIYLTCDFFMNKGSKTRKTTTADANSKNPTVASSDDEKMKLYDTWKFNVNLAIRQNGKIVTITNGDNKQALNWYTVANTASRKTAYWASLCKAFPQMENLPEPHVIIDPNDYFAYRGGIRFSISSVGAGDGNAKSHYQIEETYILPETVVRKGSSATGETISFSAEPQFTTESLSTGIDQNTANNFVDEEE